MDFRKKFKSTNLKACLMAGVLLLLSFLFIACSSPDSQTQYQITFNKQGGSGGTDSISVTLNKPLPEATAPTKDGYAFVGYYDASSKGTMYYNPDMSSAKKWNKTSNTTLYARWADEEYYTSMLNFKLINDDQEYAVTGFNAEVLGKDKNGDPRVPSLAIIPNTYLEKPVTSIYQFAFDNCFDLTCIVIPNSIIIINSSAFAYCHGLTSVSIPYNVITIDVWAFAYCINLTSCIIPSNVTTIGEYAFGGCDSLKEFNVDENNQHYKSTDGVLFNKSETVLIQYPRGKSGSYIIPENVTNIGIKAFEHCVGLTSVTIPSNVKKIGSRAFSECSGLASVTSANGITSIGEFAFSDCSSLISVTIPSSITTLENGTFFNCTGLISVTIPGNVLNIGYQVFGHCRSLTTVIIEEGVSYIGYQAFYKCNSIASITIPHSVTKIDPYSFAGWTKEQIIYVKGYIFQPGEWDGWKTDCQAKVVWNAK